MKKVAVFLTTGFEDMEFIAPVDLMRRAGLDVTTVSLESTLTVTSNQKVTIQADVLRTDTDLNQFDAIVFPGGYLDLDKYRQLADTIQTFVANPNKTVAAICAAPTVLAELGYFKQKNATCYPSMKQILIDNGANYQDQDVVKVDNFILGRAPAAAIPFGLALVEQLASTEVKQQIASGIVI